MNVWAVTMIRDEADIIEGTLRHLASEGVDGIIVADNGSDDGTLGTLDWLYEPSRPPGGPRSYGYLKPAKPLGCHLEIVHDEEPGYYQSRKMSALATMAADAGAEWIIPFDADELWTGPDVPVAEWLSALPPSVKAARATLTNHICAGLDVVDEDPFRSMVWRMVEPVALPKVAFRYEPGVTILAGNHQVKFAGRRGATVTGLAVRHFPVRSAEQFRRKALNGAEAYKAAPDLDPGVGQHWRDYGALAAAHGPQVLEEVFWEHWFHEDPAAAGLVRDPAPYRRWET